MTIPIFIVVAIAIPISRETYYKELSHSYRSREIPRPAFGKLEDRDNRRFSCSASLSPKAGEDQHPSLKTGGESKSSNSALDSIPAFRR